MQMAPAPVMQQHAQVAPEPAEPMQPKQMNITVPAGVAPGQVMIYTATRQRTVHTPQLNFQGDL